MCRSSCKSSSDRGHSSGDLPRNAPVDVARADVDAVAKESKDDRADAVGAQRQRAGIVQCIEHLEIRMTVHVVRADADERNAWMNRVKKVGRRTRRAAVMPHLEDVRPQRIARMPQQPLFLWRLRVAHEENPRAARTYGATTLRPASPPVHSRPASITIHRPRDVRTASASPCPTSSI